MTMGQLVDGGWRDISAEAFFVGGASILVYGFLIVVAVKMFLRAID